MCENLLHPQLSRCYTGARMDKPLIGYRSHIFHVIPPENAFMETIPQLPPGIKLHLLK